jgi:uncharacterized membrane protein HdeD (DUF308 family)
VSTTNEPTPLPGVTNEPTSLPGVTNEPTPLPGVTDAEARQIVGTLGKHWGVVLSFGIVIAGLGIAVMAWPDATITVLAVLLGISLLVSGIFSLVGSFTQPDQQTSSRVMMAISGALSIVLGFIAFQGITQATAILALVVGVGWLVRGIFELVAGLGAKGVPGRGLVITIGVLSIAAGAAVLLWPSITLTALAWISGLWLLILGLLQIVASFGLRRAARQAGAVAGAIVA